MPTTKSGFVAGYWIRASRYRFDRQHKCIAPAENAEIREYDPWAEGDRPYRSLLEIAMKRSLNPLSYPAERPELVEKLLDWCNRYGLLGTLLHRVVSITFEPRWEHPTFDGGADETLMVPTQRTHFSTSA